MSLKVSEILAENEKLKIENLLLKAKYVSLARTVKKYAEEHEKRSTDLAYVLSSGAALTYNGHVLTEDDKFRLLTVLGAMFPNRSLERK